jgi:hypothetical protein
MADSNALLVWEKIQPVPESEDIAEALRCEIHDPLWLLARQWQMGEFKAEDAGMAAFSHMITVSTPIQRFLPAGATEASAYSLEEQPLNAKVEKTAPFFSLAFRFEAGRMWKKMLEKAGKPQAWKSFLQNPLLLFKVPELEFQPDNIDLSLYGYEQYEQMIAALGSGRMVDGAVLFKELQTRKASDFLTATDAVVNETGNQWKEWIKSRLGISIKPSNGSWDASRLEYRASTAVALPADSVACVQMPEYNGQAMDSFSWEHANVDEQLKKDLKATLISIKQHAFIPTPVSFPGMPRARWWEFEDSTLDLSNIQAKKTELGLLLLAEFGLVFSNDWLLVPLPLAAGNLTQVRSMRITDVFGVQSYVKASQQDNNWELFQITTPSMPLPKGWLYLPPVSNQFIESAPIEEIQFIRDEMANTIWGVETTVPNGLGEGIEGRSAAQRTENWSKELAGINSEDDDEELDDIGVPLKYVIGNTVPPNWIPFIPLRPDASSAEIVFRRGAMPRITKGKPTTRIRPKTNVLRSTTDVKGRYDIQEEEIPATGLTIREVWRRARWFDGRTITWLAREKVIGRHFDSSGLQFDEVK